MYDSLWPVCLRLQFLYLLYYSCFLTGNGESGGSITERSEIHAVISGAWNEEWTDDIDYALDYKFRRLGKLTITVKKLAMCPSLLKFQLVQTGDKVLVIKIIPAECVLCIMYKVKIVNLDLKAKRSL